MRPRAIFLGSVAALGLATGLATLVGIHYVQRMALANGEVERDALPSLAALLRAQQGIGTVRFVTARAVVDQLMRNEAATSVLWDARERALRQAEDGLLAFERVPMDAEEGLLWKEIRPAFAEFASENGKVWAAIQAGDVVRAARIQGEITRRLPDRFLAAFDDLVEMEQALATRATAEARATSLLATRVLIGIGVAAFLGAVGIGLVLGRVEAERAASEERLRLFVEHAPVAIAMLDHHMRYMLVSRRWMAEYGLGEHEVVGQNYYDTFPEAPDRWKLAHQRCLQGEVEKSERDSFARKDGSVEWLKWEIHPWRRASGAVGGILVASERITEQVHLEGRLAIASRLAALGTLVAGVAHEINNPLSAELSDQGLALDAVAALRERLRGSEPLDREAEVHALGDVVDALKEAQESGLRIAGIVRDLTTYGRADAKRVRIRLADVVNQAMRWLPGGVMKDVVVRLEDGGAPSVLASPGQVAQVIVNLMTNAAKATVKGAGAEIVVRTGPGSRGMARLEVVDHGTGIDPAIQPRIFEPFFTTRPTGPERGAGLGLAVSHVIATSHGGTLTVESSLGKGSTFRLELPAATEEARASP